MSWLLIETLVISKSGEAVSIKVEVELVAETVFWIVTPKLMKFREALPLIVMFPAVSGFRK